MHVCIHAHIHTCLHTYIDACTHAHIHIHMHAGAYAHIYMFSNHSGLAWGRVCDDGVNFLIALFDRDPTTVAPVSTLHKCMWIKSSFWWKLVNEAQMLDASSDAFTDNAVRFSYGRSPLDVSGTCEDNYAVMLVVCHIQNVTSYNHH